jgi:hypothetical protein
VALKTRSDESMFIRALLHVVFREAVCNYFRFLAAGVNHDSKRDEENRKSRTSLGLFVNLKERACLSAQPTTQQSPSGRLIPSTS